jgi:hypothetical protein
VASGFGAADDSETMATYRARLAGIHDLSHVTIEVDGHLQPAE